LSEIEDATAMVNNPPPKHPVGAAAGRGNSAPSEYDAFLSYSHAKDKPIATALQSVLQRLGKAWYQRRALRVFRDDTSLPASPQLWQPIEEALRQSRFLILFASPEAAASHGVGHEMAYWLEHKGPDTVLIALTAGELEWDEAAGDFHRPEATPLPAALKNRFAAEPRWIDLRPYRNGKAPKGVEFMGLGADFAAKIQGIKKEDLLSQEVRQQRRALTSAGVAGVLLLTFLVAAVLLWIDTRFQRNEAQLQRDKARTQLLAAQARRAAGQGRPDDIALAGALALESLAVARKNNLSVDADAVEAARNALINLPVAVLPHRSTVWSMAVLTDGRLASSSEFGDILIWSRDFDGQRVVLRHGGLESVSALEVLKDGRLASGGVDGNIVIGPIDTLPGETVAVDNGSPVRSLAVLAHGRLVSGGDDGNIKIWPTDFKGEPAVLTHGQQVRALAVLKDGRLVSGGDDGNINIWSADFKGKPEAVLPQGSSVESLAVLKDGRLASGGYDGNINIWPTDFRGKPVVLPQGSRVSSLAVLKDGRLASGGLYGIEFWPEDFEGKPVFLPQFLVSSLAVLADGRLATAGDGDIRIWPTDGEPTVLPQGSSVESLAVLADGRLASGGSDGNINIWPTDFRGKPVVLPQGSLVSSLAVLADGRLASGGYDGIEFWPKNSKGEKGSLVNSLAVLKDGRLVSGGEDGNINIWPKDGVGEPVVLRPQDGSRELLGPRGDVVYSVAALADGRLASGGVDGKVRIWPKDFKGQPMVVSEGGTIRSLAVLNDGRLAIGAHDGKIEFWPKKPKGEPGVLPQGASVESLAVLKDGRLASGGGDGNIKIWPRNGVGEPVVLAQGSPVYSLAVLADGRLASGGDDGKIRLWLVDEQKLIGALCLRAGRNLTSKEWARYVGADIHRQPSCRDLPSNWRTLDEERVIEPGGIRGFRVLNTYPLGRAFARTTERR
jgi:WD40 repeat protein